MTAVLSIDQGTSGTKALVVGEDGSVLAAAERPVRPRYLPGGAVEQDPQELLDSVIDAGREAIAAAGRPVAVMTLANQGESVLAWDPRTGQPISDLIGWQDRRAESVCTQLSDHRDLLAERTGLVLDPYFSAPKQAWLRRNVTREGVVTTSDSWLINRLAGVFVTDVTTASRSLVAGLDHPGWDHELLDLFGLGGEQLPQVVACDEMVGQTAVFGADVPVGGLIVDQQAALAAESCLRPGEAKCTFGTGAFLLANIGPVATRSSAALATSVAWQARGETTYCVDGQVYAAASAVRWMQQLGLLRSAADLDRVAAPDAGTVLAVPAFAGLGAPWWRPEATASISGMTLSSTGAQLVTAILHGIAAQVAELGSALARDLGRPLTRLRADGGLTRCRTLVQAVADIMQIEVEIYPSAHATALGAAAFARLALDPTTDLDDTVIAWTPERVHTPTWSADRAADFRGRWAQAAARAL